jgi:multiple sugar transport system permease protein
MKKTSAIWKAGEILLRIVFLVAAVAPLLWLLITSVKPVQEIITFPVKYLPSRLTFENYINTFSQTDFLTYFRNSLLVSLSSTVVTTLCSVFGGYSLARFKFRGQRLTLVMFLVTQMIPISVIIVPIFLIFAKLGLVDNLFGLALIYTALNIPFCMLVIRGFFQRIPVSLEEAAMMDGCTRFQSIYRVVLPIMKPGIVSAAVFAFIGAWNELFFNSIFISSEANKTIPSAIYMFIGKYDINWGMLAATGILALIPVGVLFMCIQKFLVSGLTSGAVKG